MDRRTFIKASAAVAGTSAVPLAGCAPAPEYRGTDDGTPFTCGVLSGIHGPTEVVLWTRVTPERTDGVGALTWEVATDRGFSDVVKSGTVEALATNDWTAKVLVGGLVANQSYFYRFNSNPGTNSASVSPIGRARTLPAADAQVDALRLAFASCQNWGAGWYNAWGSIAAEDIDAVVWLGDYIYESDGFSVLNVRTDTVGTADTLSSYRAKYRMVRSDDEIRAGHAAHPFVPIWDDHEFHNDYNRLSLLAEPQRAAAAYQAWFEYMPVWPIGGTQIYRRLRWGTRADLFMLDTRQYRDRQANGFAGRAEPFLGIGDVIKEAGLPGRTILGSAQRQWLFDGLAASQADGVGARLIANQVMVTPIRPLDLDDPVINSLFPRNPAHNGLYINLDSWDSYLWERELLLTHLAEANVTNVSVLTGDIHCFWTSALRPDYDDPRSPVVAHEYVSGSISSEGPNVLRDDGFLRELEYQTHRWNPAFEFANFRQNGYGIVEVTDGGTAVTYKGTRAWVRRDATRVIGEFFRPSIATA
jgi:alkaline phosphatase D